MIELGTDIDNFEDDDDNTESEDESNLSESTTNNELKKTKGSNNGARALEDINKNKLSAFNPNAP